MNTPVCSTVTKVITEATLKPTGSKVVDEVASYYDDIAKKGGVLLDSQTVELRLQQQFVTATAALNAAVPTLGAYNRIESALATLFGWKRWLWQSVTSGTGAGLARQFLVENANLAQELIILAANHRNLPLIKSMQTKLFASAPDVPKTRLLEVLHDQIVVGNFKQLKNVTDSPLVLEALAQRYLKHQQNLDDLGIGATTRQALAELGERVSETFDEMRAIALRAGFNVENVGNGGYMPIRATQAFSDVLLKGKESFLKGFKPLEELLQKQRKTLLPVVADLDTLARMWQRQLLKTELDTNSLLELSGKELQELAERADKVRDEADALRLASQPKFEKQLEALERSINKREVAEKAKVRELWNTKAQAAAAKERAKATAEGTYTIQQLAQIAKAARTQVEEQLQEELLSVEAKWRTRAERAQGLLQKRFDRATDAEVQKLFKSQSKEVQVALNHDKAKLALLDLNARPGDLSEFMSNNFSEGQLKRLFESGMLQQLPAMSDELTEFYKGLDLGVRGLSDAIVLDPVKAIRGYRDELATAAREANLFKTAFDLGGKSGWVKAVVDPLEAASYIKVGQAQKLKKWLDDNKLLEAVGDLYIHKSAADQLNALVTVNTSPGLLSDAAQAFNSFFAFNRRSMILNGNVSYVKRVFTQNVIALYAATGNLLQLPFAMIDSIRAVDGRWKWDEQVDKVFNIGGKSYSVPELMMEVNARRGGSAAASMNDPRNLKGIRELMERFDPANIERQRHFNEIHQLTHGNPLSGAKVAWEVAGDTFNAAYSSLATLNGFLDNAFRWAAVRQLATDKSYASLDDLLREVDNYFSINADAGAVGKVLGNFHVPFAQFAINAPGAALRHAINHPWRAASTMQLYAQATSQPAFTEGELPPWLRNGKDYFFTIYKDDETGNYGVVTPSSVDFMLDSYTWMGNLARDLSGGSQGTADYVERKLDPMKTFETLARDTVNKTYLGKTVLSLVGVNPDSLEKYEDAAPADSVLGVPVSQKVRGAIVNLLPLVRGLDSSLPPSLVGQAPSRQQVKFGQPFTADPGTPSIWGAVPLTGGTRRPNTNTSVLAQFAGLAGLSINELDPAKNLVGSYKELNTMLSSVRKARRALHRKNVLAGVKFSDYERSYYDRLLQLEVVLESNKIKIDKVALKRGVLPPSLYNKLDNNLSNILNEPLDMQSELMLLDKLREDNAFDDLKGGN
jgi:hypothetical protein